MNKFIAAMTSMKGKALINPFKYIEIWIFESQIPARHKINPIAIMIQDCVISTPAKNRINPNR
jgi:hypothetical protein